MVRKIIRLMPAIAAAAALSLSNIASASPVAITQYRGHWASHAITHFYSLGVIRDWPGGELYADEPATRAEFITLINRIFNYTDKSGELFNDVDVEAWYAPEVDKARAAGYIQGDNGEFRPNDPLTRQEAAVLVARVFQMETGNQGIISKFNDQSTIADWSKGSVAAMVDKGYMKGRSNGSFAPRDNITCAETIQMMDNIIEDLLNKPDAYVGQVDGNLVVNTRDIVLKDMRVQGNLYITQGVGDGEIKLQNVNVKGKTFINGGGENSILIMDSKLEGGLSVNKSNGKIRVAAQGSTAIPAATLHSGAKLQEELLNGSGFEDVVIAGARNDQKVELTGGFNNVSVEASSQKLELLEGNIRAIAVAEGADGTSIKLVSGSMDEVNIRAKNICVDLAGGVVGRITALSGSSGTKVNVAAQAAITALDAESDMNIAGSGKIKSASIGSNNVIIEQKPDAVIMTKSVVAVVNGSTTYPKGQPSNPHAKYSGSGGTDTENQNNGGGGGNAALPTVKSFDHFPSLILGLEAVNVELDFSGIEGVVDPYAYEVYIGSTKLDYYDDLGMYISDNVEPEDADESKIIIKLKS